MPHRRYRRAAVAAAALSFVLVSTGCAEVTSGRPGATLSMAGFVQAGANATLAQKSATLSLSGTFAAQGQSVGIKGGGVMDFANKAIKMTMRMNIGGQTGNVTELFVDNTLYMSISIAGQTMKDLVGKDWASISVPGGIQNGSSSTNDPLAMLRYLGSAGAHVTSLGPATIRGVATKGYTVTIPASVIVAQATKALNADTNLSPEAKAKALQALQGMSPVVMDVWFDPAKNLLQRMRVKMNLSIGASGLGGTLTFDFVKYGAAPPVTPPPAGDVAPFPGTH